MYRLLFVSLCLCLIACAAPALDLGKSPGAVHLTALESHTLSLIHI